MKTLKIVFALIIIQFGYYNNAFSQTPPAPPTVLATDTDICQGNSSDLYAFSTGNIIRWWDTLTSGTMLGTSASGTAFTVFPSVSSTYYAEAFDGTLPSVSRISISITVYDTSINATSVSISNDTICIGSYTQLSVVSGYLGSNANWYWYSNSCGGTIEGNNWYITLFPSITTNYFVRAEDYCNTTACLSITITVINYPSQPSEISGDTLPHFGNTEQYYVLSDTNVISYAWFAPSGWAGTSTSDSISFIAGNASGYISVIPSNFCGYGPARTLDFSPAFTLDGYFTYDNIQHTPLDSVIVYLVDTGIILDSVQTDSNGYYIFHNVQNGIYNITAKTNKPWENVNYTDGRLICCFYAGAILLNSSILLHAADVNLSLGINTTDAVKIYRRVAGEDTAFERGNWVFEKPYGGDTIDVSPGLNDTVIVNGSNITQNFLGRCVGDVNYNTCLGSAGVTKVDSITDCSPGIIIVPVHLTNYSTNLFALTLRLEYDGSVLSFISINNCIPSCNNNLGTDQLSDGTNIKKLIIEGVPYILPNHTALINLSFTYYGGITSIVFNNSINGGIMCEYADSNRNPLCDTPTVVHYINGAVIQGTTSLAPPYIYSTASLICNGTSSSLRPTGGNLGLGTGASWIWYSGSCGGTKAGSGVWLTVSPTITTLYYVRAEGFCNTTTCVSKTIIVSYVPSQPGIITGNSSPVSGHTETYFVNNVSGTTYNWSAPSGWTGTSTSDSITYVVGNPFGVITITPVNQCGTGTPRAIIIAGYSLSGYFTYDDSANIPMDSVWVYLLLNGNKIDSVRTDISGFYQFDGIQNGNYNISASTHKPWNGVNVTDAVKVKRHFAGSEYLTSSLRLHAADVNLSFNINTTDAVKISRRFVGTDVSFTRGDWVFEKHLGGDTINVSVYLNDTVVVNGSNVSQNFKALCVGDVNGSYVPSTGAKLSSKIAFDYFDLIRLGSDELFEIPIIATRNIDVGAISMILKFPKELVTIDNLQLKVGNEKLKMKNEDDNLVYNVIGDELRIGWYENEEALNFKTNDNIIIISGKTTNNFKAGDEIKFTIENNPLCELADETATPVKNVILKTLLIKNKNSTEISAEENYQENVFEIYPNPANDKLNIKYQIGKSEKIKITIYNLLGEKIEDVTDKYYLQGPYNIDLDLSSFSSGVYTCRMVFDNYGIIIKKFVVSK